MKNILKLLLSIIVMIILQSCEIKSTHYFKADGTRNIEEIAFYKEPSDDNLYKKLPENKWVNIREVEKNIPLKISDKIFIKVNKDENGKIQKITTKVDGIKKNEMRYLHGIIFGDKGKWNGKKLVIENINDKQTVIYDFSIDYILKFENKINDIKGKNDFITQLDEHTVRIFVKSEEIEKFNQETKKIIITTTKN